MIKHTLIQGSPEWTSFRLEHDGASEAAAMFGLSKKTSRSELLHIKHTGIGKEFSDYVQEKILDKGHKLEAMARPIIEEIIGEDLYPVTCSDGRLSASCDGLTMGVEGGEIAFEHKQWNAEYAETVCNNIVPEEHMPQCQQIMLVTGAKKVVFVVSDGTIDNMVYMDVLPDDAWFERIERGWEQFHKDLADYVPPEVIVKPVAEAIKALPAVFVQATGMVTSSNLEEFAESAQTFIANINTELVTDEDFVNADAMAKFCQQAENNIDAVEAGIMAQTTSVDEAIKTLRHIKAQLGKKRIELKNKVTSEKVVRKEKMVAEANTAYANHVAGLQSEISGIRLNLLLTAPDFGGEVKGLKTITSMQNALNNALANNGKVKADATAKDVRDKLAWCKAEAAGMSMLFPDLQAIIGMEAEAFKAVITNRIRTHKDAEAEKAAAAIAEIEADAKAKADAELATKEAAIRAEERAKVEAEAHAKAVAEIKEREATQCAPQERGRGDVQLESRKPNDSNDYVEHDFGFPKPPDEAAAIEARRKQSQIAEQSKPFNGVPAKPVRPGRGELLNAISSYFGISDELALDWILQEFRGDIQHEEKKAA